MDTPAGSGLPCVAGIGLRAIHCREVLQSLPDLGWVEVHSENYFGGGAPLRTLLEVARHYPVSLHGVGLGLASPGPLDMGHLQALRHLCDMVHPVSVSEHLCWNRVAGTVINDLLPFPYSLAVLAHVAVHVEQMQEALGRQVLLENLSSYVAFTGSEMSEGEFLSELVQLTGCGILFDVNNLYVNSRNLGVDAQAFIHALPAGAVAEYHLAGHSSIEGCLVDTHNTQVCDEVWELYERALHHIGARPTLIEWDTDIPALAVLRNEAWQAQLRMSDHACVD